MKKSTKIWLIVAASLVFAGIIIFTAGMTAADWDFQILGNKEYTTVTHSVSVGFTDITINSFESDITFAFSDDGRCKVVCYEENDRQYLVSVENGVLLITAQDESKWYDHIGFDFKNPKITVYLPKSDYGMLNITDSTGDISIPADFHFKNADVFVSTGDVNYNASGENIKIKASTGDITLAGVNANHITLSVSTGDITALDINAQGTVDIRVSTGETYLKNVKCGGLSSVGNTGSITLTNLVASQNISIERTTGDVKLEKCDAATLNIKTDTGDITGTIRTEKVFMYKTSTGDVRLPQTQSGGEFRLTTSTGDIKIEIAG